MNAAVAESALGIKCPLCEFRYNPPPLDPRLDANTLAGVFGHNVMLNIAENRQREKTEEELARHMSTHTSAEWARRVVKQDREIAILRGSIQATHDSLSGEGKYLSIMWQKQPEPMKIGEIIYITAWELHKP